MTTFTKPSVSALAMARPSATNGNLPTFTSRPRCFASSAVMPADATSGSLKMTAGMQRTSNSALCPAITSATTSASRDALCASIGWPATSPIA